jgi:hypothetical protein
MEILQYRIAKALENYVFCKASLKRRVCNECANFVMVAHTASGTPLLRHELARSQRSPTVFAKYANKGMGRPGWGGRREHHGILAYSQEQNRASEDASAALTLISTRWADGSHCWRSTA